MNKALIIGAGPAGLTAAYELLTKTDIMPMVIDQDSQVGGLAKTVEYKGNRIDIGGHRFFSKSQKVIDWWLRFLPLDETVVQPQIKIRYHQQESSLHVDQFGHGENVMLLRPRKSRIFYRKKFFDYPLQLDFSTLGKLGMLKSTSIFFSYCFARLFPLSPEANLAQFFRNRFGKNLYETFFKDYTEKVWGIPCEQIPSSWGRQRVKDLNISRLIAHAFQGLFKKEQTLDQKGTSTSLIEQFLYPKLGPGQMWETVAHEIKKLGGEIRLNTKFESLECEGNRRIISAGATDLLTGQALNIPAAYFFSTAPVAELIGGMRNMEVGEEVRSVANGLAYRDFLIVGLLVSRLSVRDSQEMGEPIKDNWIYIQDKKVKAGRLQIFNNWSPYLVNDKDKIWLGVEYFCDQDDDFWKMPDEQIIRQAISEMQSIGILEARDVLDGMVLKVEKAYPSYYGAYEKFETVKGFLNGIENLYPIGRNGMHRYNNSDHSMLTAMAAVDNIIHQKKTKENIWEINTEDEYHEEKPLET